MILSNFLSKLRQTLPVPWATTEASSSLGNGSIIYLANSLYLPGASERSILSPRPSLIWDLTEAFEDARSIWSIITSSPLNTTSEHPRIGATEHRILTSVISNFLEKNETFFIYGRTEVMITSIRNIARSDGEKSRIPGSPRIILKACTFVANHTPSQ